MKRCSCFLRVVRLSLFSILLFTSAQAQLTIKLWTGLAGNYLWSDPNNWLEIGLPSANHLVRINAPDSVYLSSSETIGSLELNGGTIGGPGTLVVTDTVTWNGGRFSGGGTIVISSGAVLNIPLIDATTELNGWTLENNGNVIQQLSLFLSNGGSVTNNGEYRLLADIANSGGAGILTNSGTLDKPLGGGGLSIATRLNSSGTVNIQNGTLALEGGGDMSGQFNLAEGTAVEFTTGGFSLNSGTTFPGGGSVRVNGGVVALNSGMVLSGLDLSAGTIGGNGALTVTDTFLWSGGTIGSALPATVTLGQQCVLSIQGQSSAKLLDHRSLFNAGSVLVTSDFAMANGASIGNNGTFELQSNHKILDGAGAVSSITNSGIFLKTPGPPNGGSEGEVQVSFTNANSGIIDIQSGGLFLSGPFSNFSSNTLSGGSYYLSGLLRFSGADIVTNGANLTLSGPSAIIEDELEANGLRNLTTNSPGGLLTLENGKFLTTGGAFSNAGKLIILPACSLTVSGNYTQTQDSTKILGASMSVTGTMNIEGGVFLGYGDIFGDVTNSGVVTVGDPIGSLSINGDLTQTGTGVLNVDIGGSEPGTQYDRLSTSNAVLNGALNYHLVNGFVPSSGSQFDILAFGSSSGVFSTVTDVDPGDGIRLVQSYESNSVRFIANLLPSFTSTLPDTTISENQELVFTYTGTDPETNPLKFSLLSGPSGAFIDSSGLFSWMPTYAQAGVYQVIVGLTDFVEVIRDTVVVTVVNVNRLPFFTKSLPDTTIEEGQALSFQISASDLDLEPLTFAKLSAPEAANISPAGMFSWTPSFSDSGSYRVVASVGDGLGVVLDTATILVMNVNQVPLLTKALPDTAINEGASFNFAYSALDPDGDLVHFSVFSGPEGLSVSSSGNLSWSPGFLQAGVYSVVVSYSDQIALLMDTARVIVRNVNRLPGTFALLPPSSGDTLRLTVPPVPIQLSWNAATDPDTDDSLRYLIRVSGPGLDTLLAVPDTTAALDIMGRLQSSSTYTWIVSVTDGIDTVAALAARTLRTSVTVTGADLVESEMPSIFSLDQNYPNPFNPSTIIRYGLPMRSKVRVEIFDLIGRRLALLVDAEQEANYYEVYWHAEVSSGVYLYRIEAIGTENPEKKFVQVRKMLFVK